jgi:hypothetical protein
MLWFEVIAGEAITLMIGYFDRPENLAGHAIVYSTLGVSFILPVRTPLLSNATMAHCFYRAEQLVDWFSNTHRKSCRSRQGNESACSDIHHTHLCNHVDVVARGYHVLLSRATGQRLHDGSRYASGLMMQGLLTDSEFIDVMDVAKVLMRIGALCTIVDAAQTMLGGILRGIGKPTPGTIVQFLAYYVIAIPVGAFVSFYLKWGDGLYGFWWALIRTCISTALLNFSN